METTAPWFIEQALCVACGTFFIYLPTLGTSCKGCRDQGGAEALGKVGCVVAVSQASLEKLALHLCGRNSGGWREGHRAVLLGHGDSTTDGGTQPGAAPQMLLQCLPCARLGTEIKQAQEAADTPQVLMGQAGQEREGCG